MSFIKKYLKLHNTSYYNFDDYNFKSIVSDNEITESDFEISILKNYNKPHNLYNGLNYLLENREVRRLIKLLEYINFYDIIRYKGNSIIRLFLFTNEYSVDDFLIIKNHISYLEYNIHDMVFLMYLTLNNKNINIINNLINKTNLGGLIYKDDIKETKTIKYIKKKVRLNKINKLIK